MGYPVPEGFAYFPDFLTADQARTLEDFLRELAYESAPYGPRYRGTDFRLDRGYRQFGWQYNAADGSLRSGPEPLPPLLSATIDLFKPHLPPEIWFDQAVAMHYPAGSVLGWHTDGKRFGPTIVALSFAGNATMEFRPNGTVEASHALRLAPGSMYVLGGKSRWDYQHRLLPAEQERYSITFRTNGVAQG